MEKFQGNHTRSCMTRNTLTDATNSRIVQSEDIDLLYCICNRPLILCNRRTILQLKLIQKTNLRLYAKNSRICFVKMSFYRYKQASDNIKTFVIYADLLIYCVPNFANDAVQ